MSGSAFTVGVLFYVNMRRVTVGLEANRYSVVFILYLNADVLSLVTAGLIGFPYQTFPHCENVIHLHNDTFQWKNRGKTRQEESVHYFD